MRFVYFILLAGIALVFYLSWVPNPNMKTVWFMPGWLTSWTDTKEHEDLRTAVPFVALGICIGLLPTPNLRFANRWVVLWLILVGVVLLAEAGQLILPHRNFSWLDITWGAGGSLAGLGFAALSTALKRRL